MIRHRCELQLIGIRNRKRAGICATGNCITTDVVTGICIRGIQREDVGSYRTVFCYTACAGAHEHYVGIRRRAAAAGVRPGAGALIVFRLHLHLIRCPWCETAQRR